jgi:hypothetical protein
VIPSVSEVVPELVVVATLCPDTTEVWDFIVVTSLL